MTEEEQFRKGQEMLEAVARRYAGEHGLRPEAVEWVDYGYEWLLKVSDDRHTVRVGFSPDEITLFAEGLPENRETKGKIRNAFASLSI